MSTLPDARAAVEPLEIVRLRDAHGVLSVYVDADPRERAAAKPGWVVAAENGLHEIKARVKSGGDRGRWTSLLKALERLEPDLDALLDPRLGGRGRALFATVEGGDVHRVTLQMPLVDRVVLDDVADPTPLLVALDRGRAAGLVVVSHASVRVVETALGAADEVTTIAIEPETSEWREMKGPAGANPALPQHAAPQRDRFERRLEGHRARLLESAAVELERLRARRGWDRLVLAGDPRLTQPLRDELDAEHADVSSVDRTLNARSPAEIAAVLAADLEAASARREASLVQRARDAALAGGPGALGLAEALACLDEGRVEHLLFDPDRSYSGTRAPDGRLSPEGVVPLGVDPGDLVLEPSLAGHLVERALATDARVTPLSAAGAEALAAHEGIAALLRW